MKKIWTKTVYEFNKKTKRYEINENESQYHLVDDDAAFMQMKSGGERRGGSQTTVTNNDPWIGLQPYLRRGFRVANREFFDHPYIPQFSPESEQALEMARKRATEGNPLLGQAESALGDTISGKYLYGGEGFNAALDAAKNKILPEITSQFSKYGRSGGGLEKTAEVQALGDAFAGLYDKERDRQLKAGAMVPDFMNADYADIDKLLKVGGIREDMASAQGNARRKAVTDFLDAIRGTGGSSSTSTTTGKLPEQGATGFGRYLLGAGGGALAGAPLGFWGALGGAGLGLLNAFL